MQIDTNSVLQIESNQDKLTSSFHAHDGVCPQVWIFCSELNRLFLWVASLSLWTSLSNCPGFGQDRVNFHWNPGRGTAGRADPTPPGQTEPGIPYHVPSCWVPMGGSWAAGTLSRLGSARRWRFRRAVLWVVRFVLCFLLISVSLLFLFPLFAVLLNCPYPDPPVSACFFPFSSAPRRGEGRPRGVFVAGRSQTRTVTNTLWGVCRFLNYRQFPEGIPPFYQIKRTVVMFQWDVIALYQGTHSFQASNYENLWVHWEKRLTIQSDPEFHWQSDNKNKCCCY